MGDNHIQVADGTIFTGKVGKRLYIQDNNSNEYIVIASVDGNTINLSGVLEYSYATANDAKASYWDRRGWKGNLTSWVRQTVFLPGVNALVVEDKVTSPASTRFTWLYHATNACSGESIAMTVNGDVVTVTKNGGTITPADITSNIVMVEPIAADRTTAVKSDDPGHNKPWKYLVEYPT